MKYLLVLLLYPSLCSIWLLFMKEHLWGHRLIMLVILFLERGLIAIWSNCILTAKTLILLLLVSTLSYVDFIIQPKIELLLEFLSSNEKAPENLHGKLAPFRILWKKLAIFCLFLVITAIILGAQIYYRFDPFVTTALVLVVASFSIRANKSLVRFSWF